MAGAKKKVSKKATKKKAAKKVSKKATKKVAKKSKKVELTPAEQAAARKEEIRRNMAANMRKKLK